jgi:hypothetical protein
MQRRRLASTLLLALALACAMVALSATRAAAQGPARGSAQGAQRETYRAIFGRSILSIPQHARAKDGKYDLLFHFHGVCGVQEDNVERAQLNAVIVSVNLGIGSGPYEDAFRNRGAFDALVRAAQREVERSGRLPGATPGRIALSAWSAGFGAVSAILKNDPDAAQRIDAVLLADGLHTSYLDEKRRVLNDAPLAKYVRVAEAAMRGEKLFVLTHSSIRTPGYPSATETIGELLKLTGLPKSPTSATIGARNVREIYESHLGSFHVKGFEGTQAKDHVDQIYSMGDTIFPYLRERWSR